MAVRGSVAWLVGGFAVKPGGRLFSYSQSAAAPLTAEQLAEKIRAQKREKEKKPAREICSEDQTEERILNAAMKFLKKARTEL